MPFDVAQHAGAEDMEMLWNENVGAHPSNRKSNAHMGSDQSLIAREIFVLFCSTSVQLNPIITRSNWNLSNISFSSLFLSITIA